MGWDNFGKDIVAQRKKKYHVYPVQVSHKESEITILSKDNSLLGTEGLYHKRNTITIFVWEIGVYEYDQLTAEILVCVATDV